MHCKSKSFYTQYKLIRGTDAHSPGVEVSILRVKLAVEVWTEAWLRIHHTICTYAHTINRANKHMRQRPSRATSTSSSPHSSSWQPLAMTSLWWHQLGGWSRQNTASQFSWKIQMYGFNFPCLSSCGTRCQSSRVSRQKKTFVFGVSVMIFKRVSGV